MPTEWEATCAWGESQRIGSRARFAQRLDQLLDFEVDPPEKVSAGIDTAVGHANDEIMALGELDRNYHSMGTTIAMIVSVGDSLYVAGVGDSRVYLLRKKANSNN